MAIAERPSIGYAEEVVSRHKPDVLNQYVALDRVLHAASQRVYGGYFSGDRLEEVRDPLVQSSMFSTLGLTRAAMLETFYRWDMVTGSDRILHTLEDEFRAMLQRILEHRSRPARVIVLNGDAGRFAALANELPGQLRVASGSSQKPLPHFFVSDNDRVREEAVHPPLSDAMPDGSLPAEYYANNPYRARMFRVTFAAYWKGLTGEEEPKQSSSFFRRMWNGIRLEED